MSTSTATTTGAATGTWTIDRVHSHVGFAVKHMLVATFRGSFADYDASLTYDEQGALHLQGSVAVDSLQVADENLAAHLRSAEFFDSERHPRISFTSTAVRAGGAGELELEGSLQIKGHSGHVLARGNINGPHTDISGHEKIGVELQAIVDRRDFGLEWNATLPQGGLALEHDVRLEVSLELVREEA